MCLKVWNLHLSCVDCGYSLLCDNQEKHSGLSFGLSICADAPGAPRQWWFGGGTDLTPAYIFEEDVKHFHSVCFQFFDQYFTIELSYY